MKKISVVAMSVAILLLIGSCAQRNVKEATPKPTAPITKTTETPKAKPTPTVTATTTANPNAKPVPGSCLVLEEKYCKTIILVDLDGYLMAVGKLPVGTPIFSPYDGMISASGPATDSITGLKVPHAGSFSTSKTKKTDCLCGTDTLDIWYTGVYDSKAKKTPDDYGGFFGRMSKGQILARITGETNLMNEPFSEYNFVVRYTVKSINNAKIKTMFGISQQK